MIETKFGPMEEGALERTTKVVEENEDQIVERIEYRSKDSLVFDGETYPPGTMVMSHPQIRTKRVMTIFGYKMDVEKFDKDIVVTDDENEFTQCPEYRLKESFTHEGKEYPAGTLVHRSVHVQLKKSVMADGAVASF